MTRSRGTVLVGALLLTLVSCDSGSESVGEPSLASPDPSVVTSESTPTPTFVQPACDNQEAVADQSFAIGTIVRGDVDGDGNEDAVYVAVDETAASGCRAFVVLEGPGGVFAAAPVWEVGPEGGLPEPRIVDLVDVNGAPGEEVVVGEAAGASTEFVGLFTYTGGALTRVTVQGSDEDDVTEDLFAYGGSVGHIEGVGCVGPGEVVASTAVPGNQPGDLEEGIYSLERKLYEFDGSTLVNAGTERERVRIDQLERFPEFASGPFGTCEGAT